MSDWYLKDPAGAPAGPFATQAIVQWINAGQVTGAHSVSAVGTNRWVSVNEVPIFLNALAARGAAGPSGARVASFIGAPPQAAGFARQDDEHGLGDFLGMMGVAGKAQGGGIDEIHVPGDERGEHELVAAVHAVEVADGGDGGAEGG